MKDSNSHFFQREHVAGGNCGGGVVERLVHRGKLNRVATESVGHRTRNTDRRAIAFNGENPAIERGNSDTAECLQRMNRADRGAL